MSSKLLKKGSELHGKAKGEDTLPHRGDVITKIGLLDRPSQSGARKRPGVPKWSTDHTSRQAMTGRAGYGKVDG